MPRKLDVVPVEPSTGDHGESIEASNTLLREKCGQQVANDSTDSMRCEDLACQPTSGTYTITTKAKTNIEGIIVSSEEF